MIDKFKNKKWLIIACVIAVIAIVIIAIVLGRPSGKSKKNIQKIDSLALTIATMPTLDCMPVYLAVEDSMFNAVGLPVVVKPFFAQMDCDTALVGGSAQMAFTDVIRAQRLIRKKVPLTFYSSTSLYWQMIANRHTRIRQLSDLDEKMIAITRFSATDMLAESAVDSSKIAQEKVYRVQINDLGIRLRMLLNNEMDAVMLPEPFITEARNMGNRVLIEFKEDTLGAIVVRSDLVSSKEKQTQMEKFNKVYNMAVDSLNKNGIRYYKNIIQKYCKVKASTADTLKQLKFKYISPVSESNISLAQKWLDKH